MPHVTYAPADGEKREWDFRPGRVKSSVAELIENRAGCTYEEWKQKVLTGDIRARRVLLWHLLWLDHPVLKIEDVDFYADELDITPLLEEYEQYRAALAEAPLAPGFTEEWRVGALASLDLEIAKTGAVVSDAGKDE